MSFLHPEFLYYTLLPVLVLFIFLLKQKEKEQRFFSKQMLEKIRVPGNALSMKARNTLFFIVSLLIVVALAQPVIEEGKVTVEAKSADIMVALDISDSMLAEDVYPNRIERAKQKIMALLENSPQERIGVMAFAKNAYLVSPLSFDHRAVKFLVKQLQPGSITEKGTDFVQLLGAASQAMSENERKYLLILSDGGDQSDFTEEIAQAKKEGMQVFVLGIGTSKGAPIKRKEGGFIKHKGNIIISSLNEDVIALATQTGGAYIESVASSKDMDAMLKEIVSKTEKRTLAEEEIPMYTQLFYYPVALALLFLLLATSSFYRKSGGTAAALTVMVLIGSSQMPLHAGLLDFQLLKEAKQSYESGDYNRSADLYSDYASRARSDESYYNQANALYKQGSYASAAKLYEKIADATQEMAFNAKHNLGNAYAKQNSPEMLGKALEAYESALQLKEDAQTRENYETVKKLLEEQEQPSEESQESKEKQEESKSDDAKQPQEQQSDEQKPDDKPSEPGAQKPSEQQNQKSAKQEGDGSGGKMGQQPEEAKEDEAQQQQAKSEKPEEKDAAAEGGAAAPSEAASAQMSEMEAKKWYNKLGQEPVSHIYKLIPTKPQEENENAKPW